MGRFDYEKRSTRIGGPGGAKGQRMSPKKAKANTCRHGDNPSRCSDCTRDSNAAAARHARAVHRAKRVKKAKKKNSGSFCSIIAFLLLGVFGSGIYGAVELTQWIIG